MLESASVMATALQVILTEDVDKLGAAGELVKVKPGYARNFLLPRGFAVVADAVTLDLYERKKAKLEQIAQERRAQAEANKETLTNVESIKVSAKAGESGKLFGSVTKEEIAIAIKEQAGVELDKTNIKSEAVRTLGESEIKVNLGVPGVEATINLIVEAQ